MLRDGLVGLSRISDCSAGVALISSVSGAFTVGSEEGPATSALDDVAAHTNERNLTSSLVRVPNLFAQKCLSTWSRLKDASARKKKTTQFDSKNLIALFWAELRCRIC